MYVPILFPNFNLNFYLQVTVHCCLHEKTYNPYYTLILQRFCAYDRRFQVNERILFSSENVRSNV